MKYSSLPLAANNFQMSDLGNDYIKICINDKPDCCVELEFLPPACIEFLESKD